MKHRESGTLHSKMLSLGINEKIIIPVSEQKHGYKSIMRAGAIIMKRYLADQKFQFAKVLIITPAKEEMTVGVEILRIK